MKSRVGYVCALGVLGMFGGTLSACQTGDDVLDQLQPTAPELTEPTPQPALAPAGGCEPGCTQQWACNQWQTAGGYLVDLKPDHYLFVHGLHSNGDAFSDWSNYSGMKAVRALGYKVQSANLGNRPPYGKGSGSLGEWVFDLANHINTMGLPNRSLVVIAHSFGSVVTECLLEVGQGGNCSGFAGPATFPGPDYVAAAARVKQLYTVQAAHGGCGDAYPDHGSSGIETCAAKVAIRAVTTNALNINMDLATAGGAVPIRHIRASAPGDCVFCDECEGKGGDWAPSVGDLCSDNDSHDGATQDDAHQDSGRFPKGYGATDQAPGISASSRHNNYCHSGGDDYPSYRAGASRVRDLVGQTPPCTGGYNYCLCPGGPGDE
ncbi:MAG: hypothetical protein IPK82_42195 [Polyangiaceae bacterium]|nr:hypothetical protein [Polyangiaceae bacterium]